MKPYQPCYPSIGCLANKCTVLTLIYKVKKGEEQNMTELWRNLTVGKTMVLLMLVRRRYEKVAKTETLKKMLIECDRVSWQ